jgi:phosphosulfolactate synthase (CoM biosynthesis protein A)
MIGSPAETVISPYLYKDMKYAPMKDLAPVTLAATTPIALVAHPSLGVSTLPELIAVAKREPGKLSYGSPGTGSAHHLVVEWIKMLTKIELLHVPYKGAAPATVDTVGGQISLASATGGEAALPAFYDEALALGFEAIEISDNVVPLTDAQRVQQIRAAIGTGLIVFGEVGSKETISDPTLLVRQAELCFDAGAALVLVEAAELVENGKLRSEVMQLLVRELDMKRVMIELPGPWINGVHSCDIELMKRELIAALGPDLNLANVAPTSIIDTEATRVGLGTAGPLKKGARLMR